MIKRYLALILCGGGALHATLFSDLQLNELTTQLHIPPTEDVSTYAQKNWLKENTKRWDLQEIPAEDQQIVVRWAEGQGLFNEVKPKTTSFDVALIIGSSVRQMQSRLLYLASLWEEGVRFNEVVWLTGDRKLCPHEPGYQDVGETERDAAIYLWNTVIISEQLKAVPVTFTEGRVKQEGANLTIADTLQSWLQNSIFPKKCLFISSQPFVGYHVTMMQNRLPEGCDFEVVGKGWDPSLHKAPGAVILDLLARWMNQQTKQGFMQQVAEKYLYKILSKELWKESQGKKALLLSADDQHFIHFSKEDQLERICSKYWSHVPEYYILKIDTQKLKGRLVYETNPGGTAKYYHLYEGEIPLEAVVEANIHKKSLSTIL